MSKTKFQQEYEINASVNILYPYISDPDGLAQWFVDGVSVDKDNIYNFVWDGEDHFANKVSYKANKHVKFQFISKNTTQNNDPNYLEFQLLKNEITETVYISITDYSETDDLEELNELWSCFIDNLRGLVGG